MVRAATLLVATAMIGLVSTATALAQTPSHDDVAVAHGAFSVAPRAMPFSDLSAQRRRVTRAGTRLRVNPNRRLLYRDCRDWYVEERRPSGTVVVPHMRCWWVRG